MQQTGTVDLGSAQEAMLYTNTGIGIENSGGIELGAQSASSSVFGILGVLVGLLGVVSIVGSFVMFLYILVDVIRRKDLKESKLMWVVLLLFLAPVGMLLYGFIENRKKLAWISLGLMLLLPLVMSVYAVVSFIAVV